LLRHHALMFRLAYFLDIPAGTGLPWYDTLLKALIRISSHQFGNNVPIRIL
jgi:hypothetical protein